MALCNALSNPDNVAAFLLLQFDVRVEHTVVELVHEGQLVQFNLRHVCRGVGWGGGRSSEVSCVQGVGEEQ